MKTLSNVPRKPVILIILDGFGVNPSKANNAVAIAKTPKLDKYFSKNPHTTIQASGTACGLPDGQMGNSEVGHLTLGCGGIIRQNLVIIDNAISDGSFNKNTVLLESIEQAKEKNNGIHLVGLISDGGVHSHISHTLALINLCRQNGVYVYLHMITDGRDTAPRSAKKYLKLIEHAMPSEVGCISSVSGRYYAMDRDNRWERIELAWQCMVNGKGRTADTAGEAIDLAYEAGEDDEFIIPTYIKGNSLLNKQATVIFTNFRKDRPRQLIASLFKDDFEHFNRGKYKPGHITSFTEYDEWFQIPYAFELDKPLTNLSEVISNAGISQLHCAETEKYAHVTFFFNGGKGEAYSNEERLLIESPKVATYDLKPEMSASEVSSQVISAIKEEKYGFIVVNFANGDMVGHTAVIDSVIQAVEVLDKEVGKVIKAARKYQYSVVLTADHGNCDEMVDPLTGEPHTQHTVYPVPCLVIDDFQWRLSSSGGLQNIAPTVLQLMGLTKPIEMHGKSLLLG
ncbi:MAG: 2,3-bisphosphoglycerate-independent phosphoglycerate mutase [Gammaproteobacteria bacterium]|nr:2,3-bisphosphoglycerate-independent phosphoglycerate mutase [Gammaproteobacteria bacterium]